ncbi:Ig-like domain-containing protein [Aquisphaera insulae]|uniref:Ig-like domain-containing protein n=1 Tax=Aquisphaera insulae TaxID=2712864 RepID=UPI0013EC3079|nr:Ig-like domain-containing protein [Aquisphaera insulae]
MVLTSRHARGFRLLCDALEERVLLTIGLPHDGYLDISFIGDRYADMAQFHADVDRAASALMTYEPFKSRADQIRVHAVENTTSLGSAYSGGPIERLLVVNEATARSIVDASGFPTDVVGVLVNASTYGGSGGSVAVSYNGDQMGPVFAHEFCHSFGRLYDEYSYGTSGPLDGQIHDLDGAVPGGNVYAGVPPAASWSALVAPDEYYLGAGLTNWYRTSLTSLMSSVQASLNPVSMLQVESQIDYWAGPSADHQAPHVAITGLHDGDAVSGMVSVNVAQDDDRSVIFTQLWVDGSLARNSWESPFTLAWTTGHTTLGPHTLVVKAFDASGNVGVSAPVQVNLTSGADLQIVSPASGTVISGSMFPLQVSFWSGGVSQVSVYLEGAPVGYSPQITPNSAVTAFLFSPLGAGSHTLTVIGSVIGVDGQLTERYRASTTIVSSASVDQPSLALNSPGDGATVKGVVGVSVQAVNGTPANVQYLIDGVQIGTSNKAPFRFSWNTKKQKDGPHTLQVIAHYADGSSSTDQHSVVVKNVVDRKPPKVKLIAPKMNAKYSTGSIVIAGNATDNVAVALVSLYVDGNLVGAETSPQFSWSYGVDALTMGKHKVRVRATDTSGKSAWSSIVTIRRV